MLFLLLRGERSLNFTLVIFLVVIKFLAGFNLTMSIGSFVIFVLTKFERLFEGENNRKKLNRFLFFIIFIFIILLAYQGPYKITTSVMAANDILNIFKSQIVNFLSIFIPNINITPPDNIFDLILYIYGIVSLILTVYIIPILRNKFFVYKIIAEKEVLKKSLQDSFKSLKTRFLSLRKKYTEIEVQKQVSLKEKLKELRRHLAIFTLIFLGVGCLTFTPLCAIIIFLWLRTYFIYENERPLKFEEYLLIASCIVIMTISVLLPFPLILELTSFYRIIQNYYYFVYISQFIGMLISSILYISLILKPILESRKKQKIKHLSKEKGEIKKSYDELHESHKDLLKEKKKMEKQIKKLESSKSK